MRVTIALFLAMAVAAGARAEQPYLDERSDAVSLIESLYNALNRKEYARAWSYFAEPPAKSFNEFVKGYEDTESIEILTGGAVSEGAAGSIYTSVPVALRASGKGEERYFAGCYTVRAVNAAIQQPPYRPLLIEKGKFKKTEESDLASIVPSACGGAPGADSAETRAAEFKRLFGKSLLAECTQALEVLSGDKAITVNTVEWRYSYQSAGEEPQRAELLTVPCDMGAYNSSEIYYFWQRDAGFRRISFAMPDLEIKYADENSEKLSRIRIAGFTAENVLTNSGFDEKSNTIAMYSKWRGLGDASSSGTWAFKEGRFILREFNVDATYDGDINGISVISGGNPLPLP